MQRMAIELLNELGIPIPSRQAEIDLGLAAGRTTAHGSPITTPPLMADLIILGEGPAKIARAIALATKGSNRAKFSKGISAKFIRDHGGKIHADGKKESEKAANAHAWGCARTAKREKIAAPKKTAKKTATKKTAKKATKK